MAKYDESSIKILEGLEAVRKRPGMYIGSTDKRGLHHLVWEIVDNGIDEAINGYGNHLTVIIHKDGSVSVSDEGRGVPVGKHASGKSTPEVIYTVLHAGGKFQEGGYKVSGGLHGVGASVVNALSKWMKVSICRDGGKYEISFKNGGHLDSDLKKVGTTNKTGTTVRFMPDDTIFSTTTFSFTTICERMQESAFLIKGLMIDVIDEEDEKEAHYHYERGLEEFVSYLNEGKKVLHNVVGFDAVKNKIEVECALQYTDSYSENVVSFVNNVKTSDGGSHEVGLKSALTKVFNDYAKNNGYLKAKDKNFEGTDVREGLTVVLSLKIPEDLLQFEGQTKGRLGNSEVRKLADKVFSEGFEKFLLENPDEAKIIVNKAMLASRARHAAKKAREITRKSDLATTNFFGKLSDCKSKDPKVSEIFIVEGDSAGGSAKKGRDSMTQAILPLRGKILNVEKARLDRALGNEEIRTIITAFGTGIGDEFNLDKLRYDKIIIMTDADVDGSHIRVLLLTLFYRFFRPIVEAGHVYAAQPPLFRIMHGKTRKYVLDEPEKEAYLASLPENVRARAEIARMKGLGEMDAEELNETTMDIEKRVLRKITVEDCVAADAMFGKLMGEEVEPRRKFIEDNAQYVKNLDI